MWLGPVDQQQRRDEISGEDEENVDATGSVLRETEGDP